MAELPFVIEKRGTVWVIDWSAKGGSGCAQASAAEVQLWQALQGAAHLAADVAAERERCARVVEAMLHRHCAGTQSASDPRDRCNPGDTACDFVAAWTDAAAAIRTEGDQHG